MKNQNKDIYVKFSQQMGRLPIFLPTNQREMRQETLECPWGAVKITGITLTVFDEDVLYTLCHIGKRSYIDLPDLGSINTIHFRGTFYNLCKAMGRKYGTKTVENLKSSLDALSSTRVSFSTTIYDPEEKKKKDRKKTIASSKPLIYEYQYYEESDENNKYNLRKGQFYVVISQAVANLLLFSNTVINMTVKKQLSPLLQVLYRFALCHRSKITISVEKLHNTIAPKMNIRKFRMQIKNTKLRDDFQSKTGIIIQVDNDNNVVTLYPRKSEEKGDKM
jgi:mRNA-degrading endonuclease RelE of RelBE toxin-antitoxin system